MSDEIPGLHFPDDLAPVAKAPYGSPANISRGRRLSIENFAKLTRIRAYVLNKAEASSLPGQVNGPRDAYRHALLAGELTREFGEEDALAILDYHESSDRRSREMATRESSMMDDFVNLRSVAKMNGAANREEVERRAETIVQEAIREGGSGANGTIPYHPASRWMTDGRADDSAIDPKWGNPRPMPHGATRDSLLVDAILGKPGADWSEEEARLVMSDPRYWRSSKRDQRVVDSVQDSYRSRFSNRTGGDVQVGAYRRDDGTNVAAHTRSAPSR